MIGRCERRPSASSTPHGNAQAMPKIARISVTGKPPHCSVRTGARPRPPPISQNVSAMPTIQTSASIGRQNHLIADTTSSAHMIAMASAGRHCSS